jgi:hypothetical protein
MNNETDFLSLFNSADLSGKVAAGECVPAPMVVQGYESEPVMDGVCGFAWVVIKPATTAFARWLKRTGRARANYGGGLAVWVMGYNQSMTRKEAYARAFARVLSDAGIRAYAQSRMD